MKLQPPLPSLQVIQPFGANYSYYHPRFGTNGHPGIDFVAAHGTPVYAAHDGFAFYVGPDQYGGDGVWCRMTSPWDDGKYYTTIYWHLIAATDPTQGPTVDRQGKRVKAGDLLGYSDNTGAPNESSGDHLHFGLLLCDQYGTPLAPGNGMNSCVDPQPFLSDLPFVFTNNLYFGMTSDDVKQLQIRLNVSPTSGYFGFVTLAAVIQYQRSNGITPTGFVGPITRSSLNK